MPTPSTSHPRGGSPVAWALLALLLCGAPTLHAQGQGTVTLTRTTGPVDLDGRVDEPAWQAIPVLHFVQYNPTEGAATGDSSEIRLAYDDKYLYVSGRLFVTDPRSIRPGLVTRDGLDAEDHFMLMIDTYGDAQTGLVFAVNPAGGLTDMSVGRDGAAIDANWNGFWDAATTRDSAGWYAEIRIPLSTLRFQPTGDRATMGLIVHRNTAARSEFDTYPRLSHSFSSAPFRPSVAQRIELSGVRARSPLYLTPYALGGASSAAALNGSATGYDRRTDGSHEAGADAKIGLTSNITLDLTVNTDFAQVEADNQQVNLTRFSLFFPEKRQFFLEGSDIFAISTSDNDQSRLFHSRRIGLADDGSALRIYGGARAVGRVGALDFGVLTLQTESADHRGSENDAVIRVRHGIVNQGSYVGALITSRLGVAGGKNILYATDAQIRTFANHTATVQWAQSFDDANPHAGSSAGLLHVALERRAIQGMAYGLGGTWTGAAFDPGLGFQSRYDVTTGHANVAYGWYPGARTAIASLQPSLSFDVARRNADKTDESRVGGAMLAFNFKSGISGMVFGTSDYESVLTPLIFSPTALVPSGNYTFVSGGVMASSSARSRLGLNVDATLGELYDGTQIDMGVNPTWQASSHLQGGIEVRHTRVRFASRNSTFNADIARLRLAYALNSRLSATTFVQYSQAATSVTANARLRYHFSEGQDLWLVYNDLLDTDRSRLAGTELRAPVSTNRTLLMKYTYTFVR